MYESEGGFTMLPSQQKHRFGTELYPSDLDNPTDSCNSELEPVYPKLDPVGLKMDSVGSRLHSVSSNWTLLVPD